MWEVLTSKASAVFMIKYNSCHIPLPPPLHPSSPVSIQESNATKVRNRLLNNSTEKRLVRPLPLTIRLQRPLMILSPTDQGNDMALFRNLILEFEMGTSLTNRSQEPENHHICSVAGCQTSGVPLGRFWARPAIMKVKTEQKLKRAESDYHVTFSFGLKL